MAESIRERSEQITRKRELFIFLIVFSLSLKVFIQLLMAIISDNYQNTECNWPYFTIIIPAFNTENYISQCLDSIVNQTFTNIEIIVVDDCSTDSTIQVINMYARTDSRINVIHLHQNVGRYRARKIGTEHAHGQYCWYVDSDDYLSSTTAVEVIYQLLKNHPVDILHFSSRIVGASDVEERELLYWCRPFEGELSGSDQILHKCFDELHFTWTLWNKVYNSSVCKLAYAAIDTCTLSIAEDVLIFFLTAFYARSYRGCVIDPVYTYRYGSGISTQMLNSVVGFKNYIVGETECQGYLERFTIENGVYSRYRHLLLAIQNRFYENHISRFCLLEKSQSPAAFDLLVTYHQPSHVILSLYSRFHHQEEQLIQKITGAKSLTHLPEKVQTIGIFYHRLYRGGVERVISLQIPMLLGLGYRIVLFTEEIDPEQEYPLNKSVIRVLLPSGITLERVRVLSRCIEEYNINLFLYHAGMSGDLLYDLLLIKTHYIGFIVIRNELTFHFLESHDPGILLYHQRYKLADLLLVLSRSEESYYRIMGVRALYLPNILESIEIHQNYMDNEGIILWVGRLQQSCKHYLDAVEVMRIVTKQEPKAQMIMIGSEYDPNSGAKLKKYIKRNNLENNIKWVGDVPSIKPWYKKARVQLVTSSSESWSMTILESKEYGVPLVVYSLPHLELLRCSHKGYIEVEQGKIEDAAEAILSLLHNQSLCLQMSKEAQQSLEVFQSFDFKKAWRNIIAYFERNETIPRWNSAPSWDDVGYFFNSFLSQYKRVVSG